MPTDETLSKFLTELAALTQKYGLEIGGCGDCNSPWVDRMEDDKELLEHLTYCGMHRVYGAYDEHGRCE